MSLLQLLQLLQSLSRVKALGVNLFTEHDAVLLKSISDLLGPHLVSLRLRACRYSVYLLYLYVSTNTDT